MSEGTTLHGEPARFAGGLHDVGSGVHAWLRPNGAWSESNAGLVVGDGASALIDTQFDLPLTREVLAAVGPLVADAPIRTLVLTHADSDHVFGAQLVEGAERVASQAAAELLEHDESGSLRQFKALAGVLRHVPVLPVPVVGGAGRLGRFITEMLAPFDLDGIAVPPADRAVQGVSELEVGGRTIRLQVVGPAHTPGDLIVHVPDAGVCFAADILFVGVHPVMWAGPVENWIAALDAILETGADTVVPGHGPISGPQEVRVLRDYFGWLAEEVPPRLARGEAPTHIARALACSDELRRCGWARWDQPERLVITVTTMARNAGLLSPSVSPLDRMRIFGQVADLAHELEGVC